jgi:hypothetical protein
VEVTRVRRRGWGSTTKLHPSSGVGRGARGRIECPRMRRGRDGSAIEIRRGRLSSTPRRGVIAIIWPRWRGRLKERRGGEETEREKMCKYQCQLNV